MLEILHAIEILHDRSVLVLLQCTVKFTIVVGSKVSMHAQ